MVLSCFVGLMAAAQRKALVEDPERYGAEYLSKWRDDLSTWLSGELLDAAVDCGVFVRAPAWDINYIAGCDASGGRNDSFTAAISHKESDGKIVLDVLYKRRSPFNPSEVVAEIVAAHSPRFSYNIQDVVLIQLGWLWRTRRVNRMVRHSGSISTAG
jgi:hypothetical protein